MLWLIISQNSRGGERCNKTHFSAMTLQVPQIYLSHTILQPVEHRIFFVLSPNSSCGISAPGGI